MNLYPIDCETNSLAYPTGSTHREILELFSMRNTLRRTFGRTEIKASNYRVLKPGGGFKFEYGHEGD